MTTPDDVMLEMIAEQRAKAPRAGDEDKNNIYVYDIAFSYCRMDDYDEVDLIVARDCIVAAVYNFDHAKSVQEAKDTAKNMAQHSDIPGACKPLNASKVWRQSTEEELISLRILYKVSNKMIHTMQKTYKSVASCMDPMQRSAREKVQAQLAVLLHTQQCAELVLRWETTKQEFHKAVRNADAREVFVRLVATIKGLAIGSDVLGIIYKLCLE